MADIKKTDCSCRWKNCKRHGKCEECIEHHKKHKKYPLPFCRREMMRPVKPPDAGNQKRGV